MWFLTNQEVRAFNSIKLSNKESWGRSHTGFLCCLHFSYFVISTLCYMQVLVVTKYLCSVCFMFYGVIFLGYDKYLFWNIFVLTVQCPRLFGWKSQYRGMAAVTKCKSEVSWMPQVWGSDVNYLESTWQCPGLNPVLTYVDMRFKRKFWWIIENFPSHLCEGKLFMSMLNFTLFLVWSFEWCAGGVFYGSSGKRIIIQQSN